MTDIIESPSQTFGMETADFATYLELTQGELYSLGGVSLVDKSELLGVPHMITRVTYQMPRMQNDVPKDFISVEATVADARTLGDALRRNWIPNVTSFENIPVGPDEKIVYNDGSTGIRRQLTEMFQHFGLIDVGHEDDENYPGKRRFDLCWSEWISFSQVREQGEDTVPSISLNHNGQPFRMLAARGLRVSKYTNDAGEAETYYL